MKTRFFILFLAFFSVLVSCTDHLSEPQIVDEGLLATVSNYENAVGTKVAFTNGFANFLWSNGDCIGVCRNSDGSNGTAAFTLLKGGESVGNFINDSFSLLPNAEYYAFYPFSAGTTVSSFPINMMTQVQKANNETAHVGPFNYMSAKFTTDGDGKASFTFSNIGAIIRLHFTADQADTYRSLSITSGGTPFTIRANYNLKDETLTPTQTNSTFRISFGEEGLQVYAGEEVTISAVVLPDDLSQSTLTFSIRNDKDVVKEMSFAGYAFSRSKLYHFYENDSKGNPPYGGCPDHNHPHAIDLGLPSGTLWACMDLGAEQPWGLGYSFSWGQTSFPEKNNSNWGNYEFMTDSYSDWQGISKYQVADGKTEAVWYDSEGNFIGDNLTTLQLEDDAARQNWGGNWRIPTKVEMEEFLTYTYTGKYFDDNYNNTGKRGRIFYKKNASSQYSLWDKHIFVPFGGNSNVYLWTSSISSSTAKSVTADIWWNSLDWLDRDRCSKCFIRPVCDKSE